MESDSVTTAVETPSVLPPPTVLKNTALGETAFWICGVAFFTELMRVSLLDLLGRENDSIDAILAVTGSAVVSLYAWSIITAFRALFNKERAFLPILTIILIMYLACMEIVTGNAFDTYNLTEIMRISDAMLLPIMAPFACLCATVFTPIGFWMVRRGERRALSRQEPPWTRKRRWRTGLIIFGIGTIVFAVTLLPCPLYLYCALRPPKNDLRTAICKATPVFVRDLSVTLLGAVPGKLLDDRRTYLIQQGTLSEKKLMQYLNSPDQQTSYSAWSGLREGHLDKALALALEESAKTIETSSYPDHLKWMGQLIGRRADGSTLKRLLTPIDLPSNSALLHMRPNIVMSMSDRDEATQLISELAALAKNGARAEGAFAAHAIATSIAPEDSPQVLIDLFRTITPDRRPWFGLPELPNKPFDAWVDAILSEDDAVLHRWFAWNVKRATNPAPMSVRIFERLLTDKDVAVRRGALVPLFNTKVVPRTDLFNNIGELLLAEVEGTATPSPETPAEAAAFKQARADVKKWLENNGSAVVP
jgi:hypothetical protein